MLLAILIAIQVVQANEFVSFDVCYLDLKAHPWEFRPHPKGHAFNIRRNQIVYIETPSFETAGIDCTRVCAIRNCKFVVGTLASVMEILRGTTNAAD